MDLRRLAWIGVFVGSTIGGFIPDLWGASVFSFSSIIFGGLGAIAGIWVAYRLSR